MAGNIYHGKLSKLEWAATSSWPGTDLGEVEECDINFDSDIFEGLVNDHPVGGMGTFKANLAEVSIALRTALEARINVDTYFRATDAAGNYYIVHGPVLYEESHDFSDPKKPHVAIVSIETHVDTAEDFNAAPAD